MLQRIIGFFRRLFHSKWLRRGLLMAFLAFLAYYLYGYFLFIRTTASIGIPFWEATSFFFNVSLFPDAPELPYASIAAGVLIGLIWYLRQKKKNKKQEEPEEKAEETPAPPQEEEIIETTHYRFH